MVNRVMKWKFMSWLILTNPFGINSQQHMVFPTKFKKALTQLISRPCLLTRIQPSGFHIKNQSIKVVDFYPKVKIRVICRSIFYVFSKRILFELLHDRDR